ncbi:calcineurin-like phosphoesterase [Achlya hypogyna]|uniref:Serine/threonine-protein phosphatase n=1 Tax=Achlya hypogyna TaxID=1202772 RepID=A0A1V9YQU7_ACHHY|nr:calcineurin-like phosphoesterase [Achlya hypogyna]
MGNKPGKPSRSKSVGEKPTAVANQAKESESSVAGTEPPTSPPDEEEVIEQWKLFNDLENREEADVLQLSRFLQALHDHMPETNAPPAADKPTLQKLISSDEHIGPIDISDMYKGVHLDQPLTIENVMNLIASYKRHASLHRSYAVQIIVEATRLLQALPNVQHVAIAPAPHITIVGDLHGQLDDLLLILRENGLPSPENPYVFNGDFVDRGSNSVEVVLILLALFVLYPGHVFLNRGNHEDESYDEELYDLFSLCFQHLPIATVLDERVAVFHGGIPRWHPLLADWMAIPRAAFFGAKHTNRSLKGKLSLMEQAMQSVCDILWSDPQPARGWKESFRGAGIQFGPDLVRDFLRANGLALVVRSHECVAKGFEWPHGEDAGLVTLFSASNYTRAGNAGAFMHIPANAAQAPTFHPYRATASEHDFVGANLDGLFSVILSHREELRTAFEAADPAKKGLVAVGVWQQVMEDVLHMGLDWAKLQPLVTSVDHGEVAYEAFLDRYQSSTLDAAPVKRHAFNTLYRHRHRIEALFRALDRDGNGVITLDEFQAGLAILNEHLPKDVLPFDHPDELLHALDFSHDNRVNINEFMESFRLHANLTVQAKWRRARNKLRALHNLGLLKPVKAASPPAALAMGTTSSTAKKRSSKAPKTPTSTAPAQPQSPAAAPTSKPPTPQAAGRSSDVDTESSAVSEDEHAQWKLFNDLENREEADVVELSSFLRALHDHMPGVKDDDDLGGPPPGAPSLEFAISTQPASAIDITELYEGVRLHDPVTREDAIALVESYKRGQKLHKTYVMQILHTVLERLQRKPNVTHLAIAPAPHMTIVGDLHGQLDDLMLILRENGYPSPENPYVFNGDIVDRGSRSIEVSLIILIWMVVYPDAVHINRGNHEDKSITEVFGFMKECVAKYDAEVFDLYCVVFKWLPLATVLDKRILILHGGVTRESMTLEDMQKLPRQYYDLGKYRDVGRTKEDKKMFKHMRMVKDILWSDPAAAPGWKENARGAGINYGPDHVYKFMVKNRLELIIRSHECVPKGFDWPFAAKGMLVTLFSASNYCGAANNMGCFMRIPQSLSAKPSFFQYMATASETDIVASNLEGLFGVIISHRDELRRRFEEADPAGSTLVPVATWERVMEDELQMHLNWSAIRPLLTSMDANQMINYPQFLDRYQTAGQAKPDADGDADADATSDRRGMFNNMYRYRKRLQALFNVFDRDGNGTINLEEFKAGIEILNAHLPPTVKPFTNAEELMRSVDFSHDNEININEFMECFRIHANLTVQAKWRRARTKLKALHALGMLKVVADTPIVTASEVQMDDIDVRLSYHSDDDDA